MYSDEKSASSLGKFLNQYQICLIDTCSLMEDGFLNFADTLVNSKIYLKKTLKVCVIKSCINELKKHSKQQDNDAKRIDSLRALKVVKSLKRKRLISVITVKGNSNFADNVIYTYASTHRISNSILLVTQDKYLCQDIKVLNTSLSQGGKRIDIYRISSNGELEENKGRPDLAPIRPMSPKRLAKPINTIEKKPKKTLKLNPIQEQLVANDQKINCNLNNPNCKRFEKIELLHDQYDLLKKAKDKDLKQLKLIYQTEKIQSLLKTLEETPNVSKTVSNKPSADFVEAKNFEIRLMANMSNPTYPIKNKIDDLEKFANQMKKLSKTEKSQLKLSEDKVNKSLQDLKKEFK